MIRESEDVTSLKEVNQYANIIHTSGNELLQMINSVLDLSKIEAGKMDMLWQPVVIEELTHYIKQQFEPLMDSKKLRFDVTVGKDVPTIIQMDSQKLNQILRNLLMNAIKFTEEGRITLSAYPSVCSLPNCSVVPSLFRVSKVMAVSLYVASLYMLGWIIQRMLTKPYLILNLIFASISVPV